MHFVLLIHDLMLNNVVKYRYEEGEFFCFSFSRAGIPLIIIK